VNATHISLSLGHVSITALEKRTVAQQENVGIAKTFDQLGVSHAMSIGDEKTMAALFREITEPRPDRFV
jgi:hypothetical protein